ncbi:uncharacterized protein TRIVIDRAFT_70910 [Trichoderma virens Gv29-8]|uniref:Uncharacterized protein n=1 Tax=Hypocrea virens (strain Gv29-8 / FGSC 10586) TaxID=413071 RepID=G9MUD3_HYPVG|nr:uncharacterized protein TRIVIDRAFT_70910 [Trichoderma virens Gv29-8]EHK21946.1 hypothetical protein TRIVIDRAFT_70910 [Trichoderma virens Gv29-8]
MDKDHPVSEESTEKEIQLPVRDFAKAASRAVFEALFDGVEVLGVMIICLTNSVNIIENQSRLVLEAVAAIVDAVGPESASIRLPPWSAWQVKASEAGIYNELGTDLGIKP